MLANDTIEAANQHRYAPPQQQAGSQGELK